MGPFSRRDRLPARQIGRLGGCRADVRADLTGAKVAIMAKRMRQFMDPLYGENMNERFIGWRFSAFVGRTCVSAN